MVQNKVDNKVVDIKTQITQLDNNINNEKKKIKKLDTIHEEITSLNKSLNKCLELLSKSMGGPSVKNMLNDMYDSNKSLYINLTNKIDDEIKISMKSINKLYGEKDRIIKESKQKGEKGS